MKKKLEILENIRENINYNALAKMLVLILFCMLSVWGLSNSDWTTWDSFRIILISTLGTILSLAIVFIFWELIGKKSFAKDVLHLAKISTNITNSGIVYYYNNFRDINWGEELEHVNKLVLVFSYNATWYNNNLQIIKNIIENQGEIIVYLPDYSNESVKEYLSFRFFTYPEDIEKKILEAIDFFKKVKAKIYLYNGTFQSSYYLYDKNAIMSVYHHKKERDVVPAFKTTLGGNLFSYIQKEIKTIHEQSKCLD